MLKTAFQMDPIQAVDPKADSSFRLAEEAQARGHRLYYYPPEALSFNEGRVTAKAHRFSVDRHASPPAIIEAPAKIDLAEMDVIWLRQDPPFDMGYITTTHLLDFLKDRVCVVNNPTWVRNYPEKLLVLEFPDLTPPTLVSRDLEQMKEFRSNHKDVVLKPLYGNGGAGVFRLGPDDPNLSSLYEMLTARNNEPLIMQKFLTDVTAGDKRVILVDGEPVGAINRVPQKGEIRSNMHVGGRPEKVALTKRDLEICERIGPLLREKGLLFVGIDVIGTYLTEINVTSPTGIQELERFNKTNIAQKIWEAIEAKCG